LINVASRIVTVVEHPHYCDRVEGSNSSPAAGTGEKIVKKELLIYLARDENIQTNDY
jgi:hypothetical protein